MTAGELGTATHYQAAIHLQGGRRLWTRVPALAETNWGRVLDDYSEASITVAKADVGHQCSSLLGDTRTWGHELSLYRDGQFVWQGPITRKSEFRARFEFHARDMLAWLDRRRNARVFNYAPANDQNPGGRGPLAVSRLVEELVRSSFAEHDPNLLPYLHIGALSTPATLQALQVRDTNVGQAVRDLIGYGLDLFTVGRDIYVIPETTNRNHSPTRLTERDFLGELEVREVGLDAATRGTIVGAQPQAEVGAGGAQPAPQQATPVGTWPAPPAGVDNFYGLIERGANSSTATTVDACRDLARVLVAYGDPPPITVVLPANTQLSPRAPVTIHDLIPGRPLWVRLESYHTRAVQEFFWNEIDVTATATGSGMTEKVQVSVTNRGAALSEETPV